MRTVGEWARSSGSLQHELALSITARYAVPTPTAQPCWRTPPPPCARWTPTLRNEPVPSSGTSSTPRRSGAQRHPQTPRTPPHPVATRHRHHGSRNPLSASDPLRWRNARLTVPPASTSRPTRPRPGPRCRRTPLSSSPTLSPSSSTNVSGNTQQARTKMTSDRPTCLGRSVPDAALSAGARRQRRWSRVW